MRLSRGTGLDVDTVRIIVNVKGNELAWEDEIFLFQRMERDRKTAFIL